MKYILMIVAVIGLIGCSADSNHDYYFQDNGFRVFIDSDTGCEYVSRTRFIGSSRNMSPRYEADGVHVMGCRESDYAPMPVYEGASE